MKPEKTFVQRNMVAIVVVPLLVGIHWGWWRLQQNPIVHEPDRRELPPVAVYKRFLAKFNNTTDDSAPPK